MNKPKTLFFDIETIPCTGWFWRTGKQVISAEQIMEPTRIICVSYLWDHEKKARTLTWDSKQSDKRMLQEFSSIAEEADVLIGHNSESFDVKHINTRLAFHGLKPVKWMLLDDTLKQIRSAFNLPSNKLNYVCQYFGLGKKVRTGGIDLWMDVWLKNDRVALGHMAHYCEGDVYLAKELTSKIRPYVKSKMNVAKFTGSDTVCASCGGTLGKSGFRRTTKGMYQIMQCKGCGIKSTHGKKIKNAE